MSDLRDQIDSRSPAHKAELLDAVWESQEADSLSLTTPNAPNWTTASSVMSKIPPMSFLGKSRASLFKKP